MNPDQDELQLKDELDEKWVKAWRHKVKKRNRAVSLLIMPGLILMWFVGWSFYWIGSQRRKHR